MDPFLETDRLISENLYGDLIILDLDDFPLKACGKSCTGYQHHYGKLRYHLFHAMAPFAPVVTEYPLTVFLSATQ
jgi:hypothetical protein